MLKRYNDLCIILSFLLLLCQSQARANQDKIDANADFIERAVTELADSTWAELPNETCSKWIIRWHAQNSGEDVLNFVRNVFLISAKHKFPDVEFYLAPTSPGVKSRISQGCTIDFTLSDWRFRVLEKAPKDKKFRYVQELRLRVDWIVADAGGAIRRAEKIDFSRQRRVRNRKALERAQINQPGFAQVENLPAAGKSDLVNGLLITAVTGLTVFLLFKFRSQ